MKPGTQLGPYEIKEPLGKGGMGEVYRAHDSNLRRDVAIKLLPEKLATDEQRLGRLKREARSLAALNHPHIATVHGFEEHDGTRFIVMELVEGKTLAERLQSGSFPVEEALKLAVQIARALEAAHERGIVHRDLKPSNVKVTLSGDAKVLDFGLAKLLRADSDELESHLPTATVEDTQSGVMVGTPPYMSPEQVRGEEVDPQTDVWAFGSLVYEMLTGQRAFSGDSASDTIGAILARRPDWSAVPEDVPAGVRTLLKRCLQKNRDRRLRAIGDALIELEDHLSAMRAGDEVAAIWHGVPDGRGNSDAPRNGTSVARFFDRIGLHPGFAAAAVVGLVLVSVGLGWILGQRSDVVPSVSRSTVLLDPDTILERGTHSALALSPDGRQLVFVARRSGSPKLFLRRIDGLEAEPIPDTDGARAPFFSPDGQWVGYFTVDGKLKKVSVYGGAPFTICEAPLGMSGTWGPDGTIVFTPTPTAGLSRVSADGGPVSPISEPDANAGQMSHRWPQILPDGDTVLYTSWSTRGRIMAVSLETGKRTSIVDEGVYARYVPSGHLVFVSEGSLVAIPFDPRTLRIEGGFVPVVPSIAIEDSGAAHFAVSETGTLVYVHGADVQRSLVRLDHEGNTEPLPVEPKGYLQPRLSPRGDTLLLGVKSTASYDIWIYNLWHERMKRLTFNEHSVAPVWTPDGDHVTFALNRTPDRRLVTAPVDDVESPVTLFEADEFMYPTDWSPDGETLTFTLLNKETSLDVWMYSSSEGTARPFLDSRFSEFEARFSPNGRWIAYESPETGRNEVYVTRYPGPGSRFLVSSDGGSHPVWAPDGDKIFYRVGGRVIAATVDTTDTFELRGTEMLFEGPYATWYDVDESGFLMVRSELEAGPTRLNLVQGWFQELRRLVPTSR